MPTCCKRLLHWWLLQLQTTCRQHVGLEALRFSLVCMCSGGAVRRQACLAMLSPWLTQSSDQHEQVASEGDAGGAGQFYFAILAAASPQNSGDLSSHASSRASPTASLSALRLPSVG